MAIRIIITRIIITRITTTPSITRRAASLLPR